MKKSDKRLRINYSALLVWNAKKRQFDHDHREEFVTTI